MPRIQVIQNQVSPTARVQGQANGAAWGAVGRAVEGLGGAVTGLGEKVKQKQIERERFEANKFLMKSQTEWVERQQKAKMEAPEGAEGFADQFAQSYDEWRTTALEETNFRWGETNEYLEANLDKMKLDMFEDSIGFEAASYGAKQKRDSVALLTANQNTVRTDPTQLQSIADQQEALIASMPGISNQERAQLQQDYRQELFNSAIDGEVAQLEASSDTVSTGQIDALLEDLKTDYWKKGSGAPDYDAAITRLERLREQVSNRDKEISTLGFEEDMRQLAATGSNRNGWTESDAVALGSTPLEREKLSKRFRDSVLVGQEAKRSQDTSFADDIEHIKSLENQLGSTDQFDATADRLTAAAQAYNAKKAAFDKDPAGYTVNTYAAVATAWEKYNANPTPATFQNYAVMTMAQQKKLLPDAAPVLVPESMVADVAEKMSAVGLSDGGASTASDTLGALQAVSGKYYPQVLRDLYKKKAIDDVQFVAGNIATGRTPHYAQELLKASAKPSSEWAKLIGTPEVEKIAREKVKKALERIRPSLVASGGEGIYAAQVEAMTRLALYNQVKGADKSIAEITKDAIVSEYNYSDLMRVPRAYDLGAVRKGTSRALDTLETRNIVALRDYSGRGPAAEREDYLRAIKAGGSWVTNDDESGVRLIDDIGRTVYEDVSVGGKMYRQPVTLTWDEARGVR